MGWCYGTPSLRVEERRKEEGILLEVSPERQVRVLEKRRKITREKGGSGALDERSRSQRQTCPMSNPPYFVGMRNSRSPLC